MTEYTEKDDARWVIKNKLRQHFDGKIVRKDLTKKIKEGANVPVYVLEFLLGQYCSSDDEDIIAEGVNTVKRILADNFVRPDEAQKIISILRQRGSYTVIDKLTVTLNIRDDRYETEFSNETFEEHYVSVPEQGGGKLIPEGMCSPGQIYTVSRGKTGC